MFQPVLCESEANLALFGYPGCKSAVLSDRLLAACRREKYRLDLGAF